MTRPARWSMHFILLALALVWAPSIHAQEVEIIPDVVYGHKDGLAMTFDVLEPANANGAAVLYMVSGGWLSRWSPPDGMVERFDGLLDRGITMFVVRHGSSPKYFVPDAVSDVRRAAHFIQYYADRWDVDPDRLGVFGGSAGGHLSLMLGLGSAADDPQAEEPFLREGVHIASVVAYYPPVDLQSWARGRIPDPPADQRFPALNFEQDLAAGISPILFVSPDDPPTLLIHGTADELVPMSHSQRIYAALQEADVESKLILIEGAGHGFPEAEARATANAAMADWFEATLVGAGVGSQ